MYQVYTFGKVLTEDVFWPTECVLDFEIRNLAFARSRKLLLEKVEERGTKVPRPPGFSEFLRR